MHDAIGVDPARAGRYEQAIGMHSMPYLMPKEPGLAPKRLMNDNGQ